ncbi:MAG: hypothetical protein C4293_13090 [Nitrospiraceae bacterium]
MKRLKDILDPSLQDPYKYKWQNVYGELTRGDLMRLAGWAPRDSAGHVIPGLGPYPARAPEGERILSGKLAQMSGDDFLNLAKVLEQHNKMSYGTSVYFCCSCV